MNQQEIINTHKKISNLLKSRQLKDAFNMLDLYLHLLQSWTVSEKKIELENTYKLMLQYAVNGAEDPEQHLIYNKLITSIYALADEAKETLLIRDSNNYEYQQMRFNTVLIERDLREMFVQLTDLHVDMELTELVDSKENDLPKMAFRQKYENLQVALFNKIWLTQHFTPTTYKVIREMLNSPELKANDLCLLVSALTLNILRTFDEEKILLLFDCYGQKHETVKQRALVGLMLAMYLYNGRLHLYPSIRNRLVVEADNNNFKKNIEFIIIQFIRSKETENISRKMREEIFPEMARLSPLLKDKLRMDDISSIDDFEEKNPDWNEIIEQSGVGDKIKELSELQIEGVDVFMGTFTSLKQFPFFNILSNWFLPFNPKHSAIEGSFDSGDKSFLDVLNNNLYMCNSDKYSFSLSISHTPPSQRNMITTSFEIESEQLEEMKKEIILNTTAVRESISNQYLQDLYRFYKLHPYKNNFTDIFALPLDFQNTWFFETIGFDNTVLHEIGQYYFSKNHYREALKIFLYLLKTQQNDAEMQQKTGYCYQQLGKIESALKHYLDAETIATDNKWTIRRIAFCYYVLKNYEKALEYYKRAAYLLPENIGIQLNIGHCLLEMQHYQEALNIYFKLEFTAPENANIWRAIAWCSFLAEKLEQSQTYYTKLLEKNPNHTDLLNAGHVEWVMNNRQKALEYYLQSIKKNSNNVSEFMSAFEKDIPALISSGIKEDEIPIMMDKLRYQI